MDLRPSLAARRTGGWRLRRSACRFFQFLWYCQRSDFALHYELSATKRSCAMAIDPVKARSIFLQAIENHSPQEWSGYLESACGGDIELRLRAEVLLKAHTGADKILDHGI